MSKIRKNGLWLDELAVRKRVHEAWVDAVKDYYVRTPNISGTPPFAFKSDGENLRDWSMSGQTVQASTPTPSSPVAVEGVGVRTGNLICASQTGSATSGGLTLTYIQGSSAVTLDKDVTSSAVFGTVPVNVTLAAGTYAVSVQNLLVKVANTYDRIYLVDSSNNVVVNYVMSDAPKSFTLAAETTISKISFVCDASSVYDSATITIMLNTGSTAQPYEPYGYKIPVNVHSGNLFDISDFSIGTTSFITKQVTLEPNTTYTMSSNCPLYNGGALIVIGNIGESFSTASNGVYPNHPITRTADANGKLLIGLRTNGSDYTLSDYDTMLNRGSTPLPYQPYSNTTTNIYLGSASTTRRVKKLVLTGEENVTESGTNYNLSSVAPQLPISRTALICTHFTVATGTLNVGTCRFGGSSSSPNSTLVINYDNGAGGANAFKTYLAQQYANGTPVTIWYVLATPETAVVNEPLQKIGSYADEITKTGAGVDIPTTNGSNTLAVNTTVQPSGMTIQSISQWV